MRKDRLLPRLGLSLLTLVPSGAPNEIQDSVCGYQGSVATVNTEASKVRLGPARSFEVLATLRIGQEVFVIERVSGSTITANGTRSMNGNI